MKSRKLEICFMGGMQSGVIGVLTVLSKGHEILSAVSYSPNLSDILDYLGVPVFGSVYDKGFIGKLGEADILLSVHGREIVKPDLLEMPTFGGVNIHPYLYKYKGANPVKRALEDREFKASVGAHTMTEAVDGGKVLKEIFVDVSGAGSVDEIYNRLYPYYSMVILTALDMLCEGYEEKT